MNAQGHLTSEERAAYWQRTLAPEALLAASDHLQECAKCREELLAGKAIAPTKASDAEPVSYEELVAWMDGNLDPVARRELAERISNSPRTSAELVNLLRFRDEMNELPAEEYAAAAPRRLFRGPSWVLPLAAGLILGIGFLWLTTIGREYSRRVALVDQGKQLVVRPNGAIPALGELPADLQQAVRNAVSLGKIELPLTLAELRPGGETLAGTSPGVDSLRALAPFGTVVDTMAPTFRWSREKGATGYRVNLLPKGGGEVISSPLLAAGESSWTPNDPLAEGEIYEWEVEALQNGELLAKAPAPPEPEARFQVLDRAARVELADVRKNFGGSHLVLGLAYAKWGLLAPARAQFEELVRENPQSELPKKLLDGLTAPRE